MPLMWLCHGVKWPSSNQHVKKYLDGRLEGIMLQIFIIILFWIAYYYAQNLLILFSIFSTLQENFYNFFTFAIKNFENVL